MKKYFDSLLSQGISHFVYNHLQEQLEVNLENLSTKENFDSWLKTKEIIVSFNKKDLLSDDELLRLTAKCENDPKNGRFRMNKISCIETNISSIDDLLIDLKSKVSKLLVLFKIFEIDFYFQ